MPYKILYTADLHGNKELYEKLINKANDSEIKAVVLGGDLCPRGGSSVEEAVEIQKEFLEEYMISKLSKINKDVFLIMGNDDFRINETILEKDNGNIKYIQGKVEKLHSKHIVGYSFVNPVPFRLKDWEKFDDDEKNILQQMDHEIRTVEKATGTIKDDLNDFIKLSNPNKTIYVIHAPPYNAKLDIISSGAHVGSKAVREFIEKQQPYLTLHGHIHESPKMSGSYADKIGNTICINVGSSYPEMKLNCIIIDLNNLDMKYMEI